MKRAIIFIGVLVVIVGMICGISCSNRKAEENATGIVTLRWVSDPNPIRKEQIALFEKAYPGIKVNLDWSSGGLQKVLTQVAGGTPPDLFDIYSQSHFNIFAEKEAMLDITPYCEKYKVDLEDFWPQCKPWMHYKDKVYAFPTNVANFVLFYNKKLFDEAEINYPDNTWTWEDMLKAARKLTKTDPVTGKPSQFGILWDHPDILIWQNGGSKYTSEGKKCIVNSTEAKEAIRFLYDLRFKHHVMPTQSEMQSIASETGWGQGGLNLFAAGSIAMLPYGRWGIIQFRNSKDLDWDIALLPKKKEKATLFLARTTAISKTSKCPEDAFKFLLFLRSKEYNELISRSGDALPACMSIAKSDIFLYDPAHPKETRNQLYLDEMEYARSQEISSYVSDMEVERIEGYEYDLMWAEAQAPEETLDNIAKKINALIEENLTERKR